MDVRTDLERLNNGDVVLLFFSVRGQQTAVVAQLWPFETTDAAGRATGSVTLAWRETWAGQRIPPDMKPYAYAPINAPDPAMLEADYG